MEASDDGIEQLLADARRGTQRYPNGRWRYNNSAEYVITVEGIFQLKLPSGKTMSGQLIQDKTTPWAWSTQISDGGRIEFCLTSEGWLRFCAIPKDGTPIKSTAEHTGNSILMRQIAAKKAWVVSLNRIVDLALKPVDLQHLGDIQLARCVDSLHTIFKWVDEYNERYKAFTKYANPEFDSFMEEVAESVTRMIKSGGEHDPKRASRLVVGTHFIRCLFQRWPYINKPYFSTTTCQTAMKTCSEAYSTMLRASMGRIHAYVANLGEQNLAHLLNQLSSLAEREEKDAKELPYARLLEMAACISARMHQRLPLTERESKSFNLEYLLSSSANQAGDTASFNLEVAPYMGLAATSGYDGELAARRLCEPWTTKARTSAKLLFK